MEPIRAAVVPVDAPPPPDTQLVVFSDPKPYMAEALAAQMLSRAVQYARRYGVYLVPQRFLAERSLCLCLLSPAGVPLGAQRATHLNLDYRAERLRRADRILPFDTPIGRVALLVDVDLEMPHAVRQAAREGAQLLLASHFLQPFDLTAERVRLVAAGASHANGIPLVGSMGGFGVICPPQEEPLVGSFEETPVAAAVTPAAAPEALRAPMEEAAALLRSYGRLFTETGGDADAQ